MQFRHCILIGGVLLLIAVIVLLAPWQRSTSSPPLACAGGEQQRFLPSQAPSAAPPPSFLGLDTYRHWDKLSYLNLNDRVQGQSSADLFAGNRDNTHFLRGLPNGGRVLFDQTGPGLVTFMRMQENYGAPWQLALDNRAPLTVSPNDLGQMKPASDPTSPIFPYPLSLNQQESQGSSILATPLPFQQSLRWSSRQANGNFYSLYHKLPYGTLLSAENNARTSTDVVQLLRQSATASLPHALSCQQNSVDLQGKTITQLTTLSGPAQIRALTFRVPFSEIASFGNARLHISWDGELHPSVDAPLKFLVGDGAGVYQPAGRPLVNGWIANTNSDGKTFMDFNLFWPMPFTKRAQLSISTDTPLPAIKWSMKYQPFSDPPNWWGTFHATYTSVPRPVAGQDMTFLDVQGSGKIVGTIVNFTAPDGTLEGNPGFYLDDSRTPQIEVTGTEEWGLGGNYWNEGHQTSLPLGGLPSSTNNPPGTNYDGAALYRFLIADSIPFNRHALVRWQHGGTNTSTHPYHATILWYGIPTQTALLSDEFSPASQSERASHDYSAPDEHSYTLTSADPYQVHSISSTATGTAITTTATFKMALNPRNVGAFLRRTFDYCIPNQRANITLDDHFVGTWYSAGSAITPNHPDPQRCWREEDFPLPVSLTTSKTTVNIQITFVPTSNPPDRSWTAFRYQLYS
ncbi:MAG: DUF2961 domain-containing protein, partial [Ktedonobacteraceae bacterium]|nr:DUF2961 domain-containing protein [Ktedonobacteraceae bacterium]